METYEHIEGEVWKEIPSRYLKGHEVSNKGRVRVLAAVRQTGETVWRLKALKLYGKSMRFQYNGRGVLHTYSVPRLMCVTFNGFPAGYNGPPYIEDVTHTLVNTNVNRECSVDPSNLRWSNKRKTKRFVCINDTERWSMKVCGSISEAARYLNVSTATFYEMMGMCKDNLWHKFKLGSLEITVSDCINFAPRYPVGPYAETVWRNFPMDLLPPLPKPRKAA